MNARKIFLPTLCLILSGPAAATESLTELYSRMDQAAGVFTGMTATLKQLDHTEILSDNEIQTATVRLKKSKDGLVARVDFAEPNQRSIGLRSRKVEVFIPKSNTVQVYDVGQFGRQVDQFLLLGFGLSGKDLQKSYSVKLIGQVMLGDRKTTHIEIVPKSKDALEYLKKAELWIAQDSTYPVQEKIHKNAQDYLLITYSDVKLNAPLSDKELELKLPAGVNRIYPNK